MIDHGHEFELNVRVNPFADARSYLPGHEDAVTLNGIDVAARVAKSVVFCGCAAITFEVLDHDAYRRAVDPPCCHEDPLPDGLWEDRP